MTRMLVAGMNENAKSEATPAALRGARASLLVLAVLLSPLTAAHADPTADQIEAEKKLIAVEKKAVETEEKAIGEREAYYQKRKAEQDKEDTRLRIAHAGLQTTSTELKKQQQRIQDFRAAYKERTKRYETMKFPTPAAKKAEFDALQALAKQGKAMVATYNTGVKDYKARSATYEADRQR
jgi:hypothetical protein